MTDEMAVLLAIFAGILYWIYRRSQPKKGFTSNLTLTPGTYRIGDDLGSGKCDLIATKGGGDICIMESATNEWSHNFKLHSGSPALPQRYRNLTLSGKDILEINGNVEIQLAPAKAIENGDGAEISLGVYQFGVDIPPAKYSLKVTAGDGQIQFFEPESEEYSIYQDMNANAEGKSAGYENLLCEAGSRLVVEGTLQIKLSMSKKQPKTKMQTVLDFLNQKP